MMLAVTGVAVALVCFILYAIDRKVKKEPIRWDTAGKISVLGGLLTSGVVYATTPTSTEAISAVAEVVKEAVPEVAQDMFVGKPTF